MVSILMNVIVLPILMGLGIGVAFSVHPVFGLCASIATAYFLSWYMTMRFDDDVHVIRYDGKHRLYNAVGAPRA